jgi:uncharacterized membrane protein YfcA
MIKKLIMFFNSFITLTLGIASLQSGFQGVFEGSSRWTIGIGCVLGGIIGVYLSGLFQDILKSKSVKKDIVK